MIKKIFSEPILEVKETVSAEAVIADRFLSKRWENISRLLFYVLAVFLPIWFIPIDIGVEFSREISFSIIIAVIFILWLFGVLQNGELYYRKSAAYLGAGILLFVSFISSLFSSNPLHSLFFSEVISEKTITLFLGLLTMFLLGSIGREAAYGVKIVFILIFTGVVSGIYSLLQFFNILRLPLGFARSIDFNVIGTANSLAIFYAILLLMSLAVVSSGKKGKFSLPMPINIAFFFSAIVFILNLLVINYRSAWIIVLLGLVFLLGLRFALDKPGRVIFTKNSAITLLILIFSAVMVLINIPLFKSVVMPIEVSPSASATINIAKSVIKESTKNFLLGSGSATFGLDFNKYKDTGINMTPFWNLRFNQGFSYLLSIPATNGILGLLSFIVFLGLLLFTFLKSSLASRLENIFVAPIFIGILASVLSLVLYRANFSFIFLIFFLSGLFFTTSGVSEKKIEFKTPWLSFLLSITALFFIALTFFWGYSLEENLRGAIYFQKGLSSVAKGDLVSALPKLEKAASVNNRNDRYFRTLAQARLIEVQNTINRAAAGGGGDDLRAQFQNQVSGAIGAAQQAVNINGSDSVNWQVLASIYENVIPFIQGAERFAFDAYTKASEFDPQNPSIYVALGRSELIFADRLAALSSQSGQSKEVIAAVKQARENVFSQAIAAFGKAIELKPDFADAHFLMAQTYIRKGDMKEAIRRVEASKILSPFDIGIAFQLGFLYYQDGQLDRAEAEFSRAISLNPNYSNAHYFLGLIYSRKGDRTRSIDEFEKIRAFNPDNQEVLKIISNLRSKKPALEGISTQAAGSRSKAPVDK